MQFNLTTDYAIRCMLYLTGVESGTSKDVAEAIGITRGMAMKILRELKNEGLLKTTRGVTGGYSLSREPDKITLYDIVSTVEETMQINRCLEPDSYCSREATDFCPVRGFYQELQELLFDRLKSENLASLTERAAADLKVACSAGHASAAGEPAIAAFSGKLNVRAGYLHKTGNESLGDKLMDDIQHTVEEAETAAHNWEMDIEKRIEELEAELHSGLKALKMGFEARKDIAD